MNGTGLRIVNCRFHTVHCCSLWSFAYCFGVRTNISEH